MKLFLTGGFLGSGKTTAIQQACAYLKTLNKNIGVITNDQGNQQVDTLFIKSNNIAAQEVANSCFCCNYPALENGIKFLKQEEKAEIIFAESVGSCTDLAATIINPLISYNPGEYEIVLSVFADIRLLLLYLQNNSQLFFPDVTYIYQKQLEESDIIIVNKIDLASTEQLAMAKQLIEKAYPGKKILYQNSLNEGSIKEWVDLMLNGFSNNLLRPSLVIDYDTYGRGEADLTWLDEDITITSAGDNAADAADTLMHKIYGAITGQGYPIGHLKFFIDAGTEQRKISFTAIHNALEKDCSIKTGQVKMLVNARVQAGPAILKKIVEDAISQITQQTGCTITTNKQACFIPGYPRPTHRIAG